MRVLINAIGSHGDINPFIAIGRALLARGHSAAIATNPYFQTLVEEAGLEFIPFGEPLDLRDLKDKPDVMHPRKGAKVVVNELMLPYAEETMRSLPGVIDMYKPDVVLHHHICFATPWVCAARGLPAVNVVLAPMAWVSRGDTFTLMSWSPARPSAWMSWMLRRGMGPAARFLFNRPMNRVRRENGLAPLKDCWKQSVRGGDLNLGMWSPLFRGPVDGDPERGIICGFAPYDRYAAQEHGNELVERFLSAGPEPVLFTLGTAAVHVAGKFYQVAADVCRVIGRRGMLLVGNSGVTVDDPPPGVSTFTYIPYSLVMPRVAATVHHGGIGTTAQGLRAGRPTVIVPHAHDQYDNAARALRLGVSETVKRRRLGVGRLAEALTGVLESASARASATVLASRLKGEDGASTAALEIERLVSGTPRAPDALSSGV